MSRWNHSEKDYYDRNQGYYTNNNGAYSNNRGYYANQSNRQDNHHYYEKESNKSVTINDIKTYLKALNQSCNIEDLKAYCKSYHEEIKVVENENRINHLTMLIDISMSSKGIDEEKTYLTYPEFTSIIRRGNTLIEYYQIDHRKEYQYQKTEMLRKGMRKFVDIPFEFTDPNDSLSLNYQLDISKVEGLKYTFYPVLNALSEKYLIEVIKLMKANGENAQISYCKRLQCWAIASKNVCLCAKDRNDLQEYQSKNPKKNEHTRWYFAYLIGNCWFDIIEALPSELIDELKEYMSDKTFIGEYVGNQYHQHLIRYMKHTILFFGIVENNSTNNSLSILESFKQFKHFHLDVVPYEYIGTYETKEELFTAIKSLYTRIAESSIIDEEEGSVIYFTQTCARSLKSSAEYRKNDKVLSLGKLKTYEYRIYRKLREKLKNHLEIEHCEDSRRKINQFFEEIRLMIQGFNLPMPLDFYYKVAETSFDFINKFKDNLGQLHYSYIDFIEVIHSIIDDTVTLKSRLVHQDNIMTYDNLMQNQLQAKKVIEVIIYAPPCYLSEGFLKGINMRYKTEIRNALIEEGNYGTVSNGIVVYHINMHNFRTIMKLGENKVIVAFGLNEKEINKGRMQFNERMKNPLFKSYNTNKSLTPFINGNEETVWSYYQSASVNFVSKCQEKIGKQMMMYDSFDESKMMEYYERIDNAVNGIKESIDKIDIKTITEDSFYTPGKTLIECEGNKSIGKDSKYKNSEYIRLFEEHVNPYDKFKEEYIKMLEMKTMSQETIKQTDKNASGVKGVEATSLMITNEIEVINTITSSSDEKTVIVLIPMTIPGNGKTFFIDQIIPMMKKHNIAFYIISSDLIRRSIMDDILKHSNCRSIQEAFTRSGQRSGYAFEEELIKTFKTVYYNNSIKRALIYIDKNHPPNAINRSTEGIKKFLSKSFDSRIRLNLQFVGLIPQCLNHFTYGKGDFIPFSLSYFLQCYLRVKHRKDHPTLNGYDNKELISIFGIFIKNFNKVNLNEDSLINHYKLDKMIQLPFTDEIHEDLLPSELVKHAREYFEHIQRFERITLDTKAEVFDYSINHYFNKSSDAFFSTKGLVSSTADTIISKLFNVSSSNKPLSIGKIESFIYLGVIITGERNYVFFKGKIANALKLIKSSNSNDFSVNSELAGLIDSIQIVRDYKLPEEWRYPHSYHKNFWHCTTLYKGNKRLGEVSNEVEYKEFAEGKEVKMYVHGLVYIPRKIMTSIITMEAKSSNVFPHVTTFIAGFAPKKSNDVMYALFDKGAPLEKEYNNICSISTDDRNKEKEDKVKEVEIKVDNMRLKCFVVIYNKSLLLNGVMHAFE